MMKHCLIGIATAAMALGAMPASAGDRGRDRVYDERGRCCEARRVSRSDVGRGREIAKGLGASRRPFCLARDGIV